MARSSCFGFVSIRYLTTGPKVGSAKLKINPLNAAQIARCAVESGPQRDPLRKSFFVSSARATLWPKTLRVFLPQKNGRNFKKCNCAANPHRRDFALEPDFTRPTAK